MSDRFQTRKATRQKRKHQTCRVFELKVDQSKLSTKSINHLNLLFLEAKWFYNYVLSNKNIDDADTTLKSVPVKVKDVFEDRNFQVLKAHMKQGIKTRTFTNIKTLSTLKKKGKKVGRLKFKSYVKSIPLPEYRKDFDIIRDISAIRLTGLKQKLRVRGLEQITDDMEIANAVIVKKDKDYYFHITTFSNKKEQHVPEQSIGIDFGCATQLTLSNGIKIEFQVPISSKLKRLDRRISKKVDGKIGKNRGSKNRRKLQAKRRKTYEQLTAKKKDIRNKIVSVITKNYKYVCFQDESIAAWQAGGHGKKIQHSGIGGIISDLKHKSETPIMIDKFFPSTKLCPQCGCLNKLHVSERIYKCECGFIEDRDLKSARCIEVEGMKMIKIPMDYRDIKLEENLSSTCFNPLTNINGVKASKTSSLSQEVTGLAPS